MSHSFSIRKSGSTITTTFGDSPISMELYGNMQKTYALHPYIKKIADQNAVCKNERVNEMKATKLSTKKSSGCKTEAEAHASHKLIMKNRER